MTYKWTIVADIESVAAGTRGGEGREEGRREIYIWREGIGEKVGVGRSDKVGSVGCVWWGVEER